MLDASRVGRVQLLVLIAGLIYFRISCPPSSIANAQTHTQQGSMLDASRVGRVQFLVVPQDDADDETADGTGGAIGTGV